MYEYRKPKGIPQPEIRMCQKCGLEKNALNDFYWAKSKGEKHPQSQCKACFGIAKREYYLANKDKYAELARIWRAKNPEKAKMAWTKANKKSATGPRKFKSWTTGEVKECCDCHSKKDAHTEFFWHNSYKHPQPAIRCKACHQVKSKAWKQANKTRINAIYRERYYTPKMQERKRRYKDDPVMKKRRVWYTRQRKHRILRVSTPESALLTPEWFNQLCSRQNGLCKYCHKPKKLTLDHVDPISRGGLHIPSNVVAACGSCNSSKKDKLMVEWKPEFVMEFYN